MSDHLKEMRERSQKRKQLMAAFYGVQNPNSLKSVLKTGREKDPASKKDKTSKHRQPISQFHAPNAATSHNAQPKTQTEEQSLTVSGQQDDNDTEEVYRDSSAFLKGTQSANPHNDYCQHFVDTGERPQNFIRDVGLANRFEEYPKHRELLRLKDELISKTNTPPMYLKADLETYDLRELNCQFDVILIEPPLEEYQRTHGAVYDKYWDWDDIESLDIPSVAAQRSFIWIWCGNAEGLERGRICLMRWGFRRCEDICWIKTNIKNPRHNKNLQPHSSFQRTKEHCLMGIKGTVKRSTDGDFIHSNVDIDLIIEEEPEYGSKEKPVEIFHIIEHFCLGKRRLHLFGRDSTIRPGWLTIGPEISTSNFDTEMFGDFFSKTPNSYLTGCSEDIERLRPKSPTQPSGGDNWRGRGRGGQSMGAQANSRGNIRPKMNNRGAPSTRGPARGFRGGRGGFKPRAMREDFR